MTRSKFALLAALVAAVVFVLSSRHQQRDTESSPIVPLREAATVVSALPDPSGKLFAPTEAPQSAWRPVAKVKWPAASWLHPRVTWFRFSLKPTAGAGEALLQAAPTTESLLLYVNTPGGLRPYGWADFGASEPFADRAFPFVWPTVSLPKDVLAGAPAYVRVVSEVDVPTLRIATEDGANAEQRDDFTTRAFFVGMIFAFGLANLLMGWRLGDRALYLFAGLAFSGSAWFATQGLLTSVYLWPHRALPFIAGHRIVVDAYAIFLVLFTRRFLDLPAAAKGWDRALLAMLGFFLVSGWLGDVVPSLRLVTVQGDEVTLMALAVLVFVVAIARARAGFPGAGFMVLASGGVVVGWILAVLAAYDVIPLLGRPIMMATAWQSLLLALALADRILRANRERDREKDARLRVQADALEAERESNRTLQAYNDAFARFVPREFLQYLERESILHVQLGDQVERSMAVLFSDIRSFTSISESLGAAATFNYLNDYLQAVGPIVREHGGFIDKYIGDAIMALFPGGADAALAAGIALQRAVDAFNERPHPSGVPPIEVGVGLHSGSLMLGTIGEERRLETTVIADAVNLASRVEGLTKVYGARILLTGGMRDALTRPGDFALRPLGRVAAKGKREGIALYECFDADEPRLAAAKRSSLEEFAKALDLFARGDFAGAEAGFGAILSATPDDAAAGYYSNRAASFPPDSVAAWDGVERMEIK
jgi:adenylate cyclase